MPPCELTIRRWPAIAGLEAISPLAFLDQDPAGLGVERYCPAPVQVHKEASLAVSRRILHQIFEAARPDALRRPAEPDARPRAGASGCRRTSSSKARPPHGVVSAQAGRRGGQCRRGALHRDRVGRAHRYVGGRAKKMTLAGVRCRTMAAAAMPTRSSSASALAARPPGAASAASRLLRNERPLRQGRCRARSALSGSLHQRIRKPL